MKKCSYEFSNEGCFPIGSYCSEVPCVACPLAISKKIDVGKKEKHDELLKTDLSRKEKAV